MEEIIKTLQRYGMDKDESRVYINLLAQGPEGAGVIAKRLGLNRVRVYRILKRLEAKGVVKAVLGRPVKYVAISLEEAINRFIESERKKIQLMEAERKKLLESYMKIFESHPPVVAPKFRILNGRRSIFNFLSEMFEGARKEISLMTTVNDLYGFTYVGLDEILKRKAQSGVKIKILTEISEKTIEVIENYLEFAEVSHRSLPGSIRFVTVDGKESFTSILMDDSVGINVEKDAGLWTDSADYAEAMKRFFEDFWSRGVEAVTLIKELRSLAKIRRFLMSLNVEMGRNGWILEMPGEEEGDSGIKHRFDVVIKNLDGSKLLVADIVVRREKTMPSIMALHTKALDVNPSFKFLIIDNFILAEEEENLARRYRIEIISENNLKDLLGYLK